MASLGSLYFDVKFKDDPKELEAIKKRVLEQLKDIEIKFDINTGASKNSLDKDIEQILSKERKVNISVDREKLSKGIKEAVSGDEIQLGYIDSLIAKKNELEKQFKSLSVSDDGIFPKDKAEELARNFMGAQNQMDAIGKNLSSVFAKSFSDIGLMSEKTIGDIQDKIKFLNQYKLSIPIENDSGIKAVDILITRLKSTIDTIKNEPSIDPFSLAEKTLDNIKTKIATFAELKGKSVINSDEYNKATVELDRLKALQKEVLNPPPPAKTFIDVMGMDAKSLDQIKVKLNEIRKFRSGIDLTSGVGMSMANELSKEESALLRVQKEHLNNINIQGLAEGSIQQLRVEVSQLVLAYDALSREERNNTLGQEFLTKIQKTTLELSEAEQASLRYQRNVGNYGSTWNGLSFQVQQVARELPSMAYGANIFFAAISNNLPMLTDELSKAKKEYEALRMAQSQGMRTNEKAIPVWKQIAGSIFSWQTAIVAVVTVLTLYGGKMVDWISNTLKFGDAVKLSREEIKKLNEDLSSSLGKELSQLDSLFDKLNSSAKGTTEWKDARANIINQYGDLLSGMNSEITSLDNQRLAYQELTRAIYEKTKAQVIENANAGYAEERIKKQGNAYNKIYDDFINKFGNVAGNKYFSELQSQLETAGKLDSSMQKIVDELFSSEKYIAMGTSTSGSVQSTVATVNYVKDNIGIITKAQDEYSKKVAQTEKQFAYFGGTVKTVTTENKAYWENQKNALQKELNGLTEIEAASKKGLDLKKQIADIDAKLSVYETSKDKSSSKSNDPLRERLDLLKNAYSLYKEFLSLGIGKNSAINVVNDLLGIDYNPDDQEKKLKELNNDAKKSGNKQVRIDTAKELTGLDKEDITQSLADMEKYISDTIAKWDLFKSLSDKTNNYEFSVKTAFGGDINYKSVLDQLRSEIEAELSKSETDISFDELIGMSPDNVKTLYGGTFATYVKSYQEQQKKAKEDSLKNAAELLNVYRDYEQKRADIVAKGEKDIADLRANGADERAIAEARKKTDEAVASLDFDQFKDSDSWVRIFSDLDNVSTKTIRNIRDELKELLTVSGVALNPQDIKAVTDALGKMEDQLISRSPFQTLSQGISEYKESVLLAKKAQEEMNLLLQEGLGNSKEYADAERALADATNSRMAALNKSSKSINTFGQNLQQYTGAAQDVLDIFDSLGVDVNSNVKKYIEGTGEIADGLAQIDLTKPGTIITGTIKMLKGTITQITSLFGMGSTDWTARFEEMKQSLGAYIDVLDKVIDKQEKMLDGVAGSDAVAKKEEAIKAIREQIEAYRKLVQVAGRVGASWNSHSNEYKTNKALAGYWKDISKSAGVTVDSIDDLYSLSGEQLSKIMKDNAYAWSLIPEDMRQYFVAIIDAEEAIKEFSDKANEAITGISFDSVKDGLDDLLMDADTTMADIADSFEDMMRTSILNVVKNKYLSNQLEAWYKDFVTASEDDKLTEAETADLQKKYTDLVEYGQKMYDDLLGAAGISKKSSNDKGLSAGIKGITEDTANLLASYANAMRSDISQILAILKDKYGISDMVVQQDGIRDYSAQIALISSLVGGTNMQLAENNAMAQAQLIGLRKIADNTAAIADSNSEILEYVNLLSDNLSGAINGTKRINVK